jgi:hypothetical protein
MVKIPCARSAHTGKLVTAKDAHKQEEYLCVEAKCSNSKLILRKGDRNVHHFAHRHSEDDCVCGGGMGESQMHITAKHMLCDNLTKFAFKVQPCNTFCEAHVLEFNDTHTTQVEMPLGAYYLDVGVCNQDGDVVAALEVRHTHAVPDEKRRHLNQKLKHGVVEVAARDVLLGCHLNTLSKGSICNTCVQPTLLIEYEEHNTFSVELVLLYGDTQRHTAMVWKSSGLEWRQRFLCDVLVPLSAHVQNVRAQYDVKACVWVCKAADVLTAHARLIKRLQESWCSEVFDNLEECLFMMPDNQHVSADEVSRLVLQEKARISALPKCHFYPVCGLKADGIRDNRGRKVCGSLCWKQSTGRCAQCGKWQMRCSEAAGVCAKKERHAVHSVHGRRVHSCIKFHKGARQWICDQCAITCDTCSRPADPGYAGRCYACNTDPLLKRQKVDK